jgi:hypothetical protein
VALILLAIKAAYSGAISDSGWKSAGIRKFMHTGLKVNDVMITA